MLSAVVRAHSRADRRSPFGIGSSTLSGARAEGVEDLVERDDPVAGQATLVGAHASEFFRVGLARAEHAVGELRVAKEPRVEPAQELRRGAAAANES